MIAKDCGGTVPEVAAGTPANGNIIGPFTPGAAWCMCPAVAAEVKPEKVTVTVIIVWFGESATVATPVPGEPLGGTSCAPVNVGIAKHAGVGVAVGVFVGVAVGVFVGVAVGVAVGVFVGVELGEIVAVQVREGVALGLSLGVEEAVREADSVGLTVGEPQAAARISMLWLVTLELLDRV